MSKHKILDYDAIRKDLESMEVVKVANKHGCSSQIIYHVRRTADDFIPKISKTSTKRKENKDCRFVTEEELENFLGERKNFTAWIIGKEDDNGRKG